MWLLKEHPEITKLKLQYWDLKYSNEELKRVLLARANEYFKLLIADEVKKNGK